MPTYFTAMGIFKVDAACAALARNAAARDEPTSVPFDLKSSSTLIC